MALGKLSADSWTVLVYMAADNNLATNGKLDINSMESVPQPENLNLIVQADFPEGAKRYRIKQDNSAEISSPVLQHMGSIDSGSYHTLQDFINWGFAAYPSDKKMLVIWSHSNSWYKSDDSKWICPDDGSQNLISVYNGDLARAFQGTPHLDVLMFDACSMQGIEVLTEVHQFADYVIGSADLVPVNGFPYETIIPLFSGNLDSIITQIPELYVESYLPLGELNPGPYYWTITCSSIATALIPQFNTVFSEFNSSYYDAASSVMNIRQQCFSMNDGMADVDMRQFLGKLSDAGLPGVSNLAVNLSQMWDTMVINSAATSPMMVDDIGTAALWFPDFRLNFTWGWNRYSNLSFAETGWGSFVNNALGDNVAPLVPVILSKHVDNRVLYLKVQAPPDPDALRYELRIMQNGNQSIVTYQTAEKEFMIQAPVYAFGSYRLQAFDPKGNASEVVEGSYSFSEVNVSPNPIRIKQLAMLNWLAGEDVSGELKLEIFNVKGQRLIVKHLGQISFGQGFYPLFSEPEFSSLPAGIYILRTSMGARNFNRKFTILR
jgi:hypothetical protein